MFELLPVFGKKYPISEDIAEIRRIVRTGKNALNVNFNNGAD